MNKLRLVNDEISQLNTGHLKHIVGQLRFKLLLESEDFLSKSKKEIRRMTIKSVFNLANILSGISGNVENLITGTEGFVDLLTREQPMNIDNVNQDYL